VQIEWQTDIERCAGPPFANGFDRKRVCLLCELAKSYCVIHTGERSDF